MGLNPLHFNGAYVRNVTVCGQPWLQYPWQAVDRVGREEVAQAIAQAESDMEQHLHFRLLPSWERDERHKPIRPNQRELHNLSNTELRGYAQALQTNFGHFQGGGIRSKELVQADVAVVLTDEDGDGYFETATFTLATTLTDPCELALYYPVTEAMVPAAGDSMHDSWEIRPAKVSITGGTATIRTRREQLIKPSLQLDTVPPADDSHMRGIDGSLDNNFVTVADVYRIYHDPQLQVQFLWEPGGCAACSGGGCEQCAFQVQYGCLMMREDPRDGFVSYRPTVWNSETLMMDGAALARGTQPDILRLYYYAGWRDNSKACSRVDMDDYWERSVAYYAAALLDRPICECNNMRAFVGHWQEDLAITRAGGETHRIAEDDLNNPFGTTRGAVFAWKRVKAHALVRGAS